VGDAGIEIDDAADHGVSEAVYSGPLTATGSRLYRDRAPEAWPRDEYDVLVMVNDPLDLPALMAEAQG